MATFIYFIYDTLNNFFPSSSFSSSSSFLWLFRPCCHGWNPGGGDADRFVGGPNRCAGSLPLPSHEVLLPLPLPPLPAPPLPPSPSASAPVPPPLSAVATAAFPRPLPLSPPPRPPPPMSSLGLCHCPPSTGPAVFPRPMRLSPSAAAGGPRYAPTRNHVDHVTPPIKKTVNPPPPPHPPPSSSFLFQTQNGG